MNRIEYNRRYRAEHASELREYEKRRQKARPERVRDPQRLKARYALREAVKAGRITKPRVCSECGCDGILDGHHEDYIKPFDVVWLCRSCHGKKHRTA